jgi:hypothetical protein
LKSAKKFAPNADQGLAVESEVRANAVPAGCPPKYSSATATLAPNPSQIDATNHSIGGRWVITTIGNDARRCTAAPNATATIRIIHRRCPARSPVRISTHPRAPDTRNNVANMTTGIASSGPAAGIRIPKKKSRAGRRDHHQQDHAAAPPVEHGMVFTNSRGELQGSEQQQYRAGEDVKQCCDRPRPELLQRSGKVCPDAICLGRPGPLSGESHGEIDVALVDGRKVVAPRSSPAIRRTLSTERFTAGAKAKTAPITRSVTVVARRAVSMAHS